MFLCSVPPGATRPIEEVEDSWGGWGLEVGFESANLLADIQMQKK